jgi:hypothetical protein
LNVDACSFLNELALLIELCSLSPLLHLLTHSGYLDDKSLIVELIGNIEASLHVSHLDGSPGDTSIALSVMLLNINLLIVLLIRVKKGFLV